MESNPHLDQFALFCSISQTAPKTLDSGLQGGSYKSMWMIQYHTQIFSIISAYEACCIQGTQNLANIWIVNNSNNNCFESKSKKWKYFKMLICFQKSSKDSQHDNRGWGSSLEWQWNWKHRLGFNMPEIAVNKGRFLVRYLASEEKCLLVPLSWVSTSH